MRDQKPPKEKPKKKRGVFRLLFIILFAVLGIGLAVVGFLVITELETGENKDAKQPTPEQIAAEQKKLAKKMEKTATRETFHCNLLYQYYDGPEPKLPLAELVGLSLDSTEDKISARCAELFPTVKLMGGWPISETPQDNFIVCEGFQVVVPRRENLTITPTRADLARGRVSYGVPGKWSLKEYIAKDYARRLSIPVLFVVQVDGRCILVGLSRTKTSRQILGIIRRVE